MSKTFIDCFDFKDWEKAFAKVYEEKAKDDSVGLLISTHHVTSGYWIERNVTSSETGYAYSTLKEIKALERRVRKAIKEKQNPGLIL